MVAAGFLSHYLNDPLPSDTIKGNKTYVEAPGQAFSNGAVEAHST